MCELKNCSVLFFSGRTVVVKDSLIDMRSRLCAELVQGATKDDGMVRLRANGF